MKPNPEPVLCAVQRARWEAMVKSPICMEHYGNYSSTKQLKIIFTIFLMRAILSEPIASSCSYTRGIGVREGNN